MKVGSLLHGKKKKEETDTKTEKTIFTMTSGGFVIVARNNSFINRK